MVTVVIQSASAQSLVEVSAAEGERLVDICDAHDAPVPFSCRSASCGTCRVDVLEGGTLLTPPSADERELLILMGDDPSHHRLACQARVGSGNGRLCVRASLEW